MTLDDRPFPEPPAGACEPDLLDRLVAYLKHHDVVMHLHPVDGTCVRMSRRKRPEDFHLTLDELRQKLAAGA